MLKVYILKLTSPICEKDTLRLLSGLNDSELEMLPDPNGKNFELSLVGKNLAKKIISDETLIPVKEVILGKTELGKPVIEAPSSLNLDISISHSGSHLAIGICDNGRIGVDIELLKYIDFEALKDCFSVSEETYIDSGKRMEKKRENFYEIWTRKEALLKALGTGLQRPLPVAQFYPGQIKPRSKIWHDNKQYYFSTLKEDEFVLSVCTSSFVSGDQQSYTKLTIRELLGSINALDLR